MYSRQGFHLSQEVEDIVVADLALTVAFALVWSVAGSFSMVFYLLPIIFVAVSLSFILHELMHKFVAQHYGAIAAFRRSDRGIMITLFISIYSFISGIHFLLGIPGATMIYSSRFSKNQEGYVSLAGPLTNFAVFAVSFLIGNALFPNFLNSVGNLAPSGNFTQSPYLENMLGFLAFISLILAFFNMLPIFPLDGSKVLRWHKPVYFGVVSVLFVLLYIVIGYAIVVGLLFFLVIALIMSLYYRTTLF